MSRLSLENRAIISFGRDSVNGVYFRLGQTGAAQYFDYKQEGGLVVAGSISTRSTVIEEPEGDEEPASMTFAEYIEKQTEEKITALQEQLDGVVESWNFPYTPTPGNIPASGWATEDDKRKHLEEGSNHLGGSPLILFAILCRFIYIYPKFLCSKFSLGIFIF